MEFRQPMMDLNGKFTGFYYWGYIDKKFINPAITDYDTRKESNLYIELKDIHKNKIYEGDIVKAKVINAKSEKNNNITLYGIVFHDEIGWCIETNLYDFPYVALNILDYFNMEIIGNEWENPELIKKIENSEKISI